MTTPTQQPPSGNTPKPVLWLAISIIFLLFAASLAIMVHDYWVQPQQMVPNIVSIFILYAAIAAEKLVAPSIDISSLFGQIQNLFSQAQTPLTPTPATPAPASTITTKETTTHESTTTS